MANTKIRVKKLKLLNLMLSITLIITLYNIPKNPTNLDTFYRKQIIIRTPKKKNMKEKNLETLNTEEEKSPTKMDKPMRGSGSQIK
jgi:hypothetical protein